MSRRSVAALLTAASAVVLTGCTGTAPPAAPPRAVGPAGPISVRAADTTCDISPAQAPAGTLTFVVTNTGAGATGFALYGKGDQVLGEVENIGPGTTRQLVVEVPQDGAYTTACTPGTAGGGIRAPFRVTGSVDRSTRSDAGLVAAGAGYQRYVATQVSALLPKTQELADAIKAGQVDRARAVYPVAHAFYERVEPMAELFGTLDHKIDGREDDPHDPGVGWTGFHRLEKDLWVDGIEPDSSQTADQLVTDLHALQAQVARLKPTPEQMASGANELVAAVATSKLAGDEDRYAHTDLWDLQANLEGAQAVVAALRPVMDEKDPTAGPVLDRRFAAVGALLAGHRVGEGFASYTALTPADIRKMTDAIDALSEAISKVAGIVTS